MITIKVDKANDTEDDKYEPIHLAKWMDREKKAGNPVKLIRMRVAVKAVKLLFKELVLSRKSLE